MLQCMTYLLNPETAYVSLNLNLNSLHMNYVLVPADKAANNVVVV